MRRIVIIIVLIVLVLFVGYWVWNHNHGGNVFGDGAITEHDTTPSNSNDQSAMNSGSTTDLDGNAAHPTPSRSDEPGTINTVPVGSTGSQSSSGASNPPMGTPLAANTPPPSPSPVSAPGGLTSRSNQPVLGPGGPLPAADTIAPNPPNHVAFGGTGKYMWYRQGDLTWRVNSDTGASCIAFATMQQWARPIVYQNGCDSRRG